MAIYFFDMNDGATHYVDDEGIDVQDRAKVQEEALGVLTEFANNRPPGTAQQTYTVTVRDKAAKPVFRADVVVTARWLDAPVT